MNTKKKYTTLQTALSQIGLAMFMVVANLPEAINGPAYVKPMLRSHAKPSERGEVDQWFSIDVNPFLKSMPACSEETLTEILWDLFQKNNLVIYKMNSNHKLSISYRFDGKNFNEC